MKPISKKITITRGTAFGPYTVTLAPLQTGEACDIDSAFVRFAVGGSTVDVDCTTDNAEKTAEFSLTESEADALVAGNSTAELVVVDSLGEDRIPLIFNCTILERL